MRMALSITTTSISAKRLLVGRKEWNMSDYVRGDACRGSEVVSKKVLRCAHEGEFSDTYDVELRLADGSVVHSQESTTNFERPDEF
jgi:hypothetical protein